MNGRRTPAWWMVRLELAVGIGLTLLVGQLGWDLAMTVTFGGGYGQWALGPVVLPKTVVVSAAAFVIALGGLAQMVRIIRGPSDEPPVWRYRDR
jgi:hypothetical protein